jgi:hypothetical protein
MAKIKYLILFLFLTTVAIAQENTCRYETTTQTMNGNIVSTAEIRVCNEVILLNQKSWWESFIQSPEYTNTLIILLATLLN